VLSFVSALSLYRDRSMADLLRLLMEDPMLGPNADRAPTTEAMIHARARLGWEPLRQLFRLQAGEFQPPATWRGFRVWALDGVRFTMPESPANNHAFGRVKGSRGVAAYPQMLAVCLVDVHGHRVREVTLDRHCSSERAGLDVALEHLDAGDLVTLDRGFSSAEVFQKFDDAGVRFLARISNKWRPRYLAPLTSGGWLVEVKAYVPIPPAERRPGGRTTRTVRVRVRLVEYKLGRGKRIRGVTNLDHDVCARELAELYWRRWECELAFDEQKNHLAVVHHARPRTTFRSKTPEGVLQEAYGMLVVYNAIRTLMVEAAETASVDPLHLSFRRTVQLLRDQAPILAALPSRENRRTLLLRAVAALRNPRPRRNRARPRVVKRKMSNFNLKRSGHRERRTDWSADLRVMQRRSPSGRAG
jgi:hypothetical protein